MKGREREEKGEEGREGDGRRVRTTRPSIPAYAPDQAADFALWTAFRVNVALKRALYGHYFHKRKHIAEIGENDTWIEIRNVDKIIKMTHAGCFCALSVLERLQARKLLQTANILFNLARRNIRTDCTDLWCLIFQTRRSRRDRGVYHMSYNTRYVKPSTEMYYWSIHSTYYVHRCSLFDRILYQNICLMIMER